MRRAMTEEANDAIHHRDRDVEQARSAPRLTVGPPPAEASLTSHFGTAHIPTFSKPEGVSSKGTHCWSGFGQGPSGREQKG